MSPDKEQALIVDFPNLYHGWPLLRHGPLSKMSFWCADGWEPLIIEVSAKLEEMISALPEEGRGRYRAQGVKEKFGLLRIYLTDSSEQKMIDVLAEAEEKSGTICEECGQGGQTRRAERSGIRTHCDACWFKYQEELY